HMTYPVPHGLSDRVSHRPDWGQAACGFEHLVTAMAALGTVAVKQAFAARAANHQRELPCEVKCVLHTSVHALPTGRAVDVRSIAGEKDAAPAVLRNLAAVDAEARQPDRVEGFHSGGAPPVDDSLCFFQCRRRRILGAGRREVRQYPVATR